MILMICCDKINTYMCIDFTCITITITITNSLFRQISCSISLEKKGQF